jgi:hypothetical protein
VWNYNTGQYEDRVVVVQSGRVSKHDASTKKSAKKSVVTGQAPRVVMASFPRPRGRAPHDKHGAPKKWNVCTAEWDEVPMKPEVHVACEVVDMDDGDNDDGDKSFAN